MNPELKIPRTLGWFISEEKEEDRDYAFYLAIMARCHEGVIHKFKSIIPELCEKIDIHENTFRKRLNNCIRLGLLSIDDAGGLRFTRARKVLEKLIKLYPLAFKRKICKRDNTRGLYSHLSERHTKKYYYTDRTKYEDLVWWIKSLGIVNLVTKQNYEIRKGLKKGRTPILDSVKGSFSKSKSVHNFHPTQISRKRIADIMGLNSNSSASYGMKILKKKGFVSGDEKRTEKICLMGLLEFNYKYSDNGRYFLSNGYLHRVLCNLITLNKSCYFSTSRN